MSAHFVGGHWFQRRIRMKNRHYINNGWKFCEEFTAEMIQKEYDDSRMQEVRIPHTCKELPFHYFDEAEYQMLCGYRKKLEIPKKWEEKQLLLTFEGVAHSCEVYVNGRKAGEHYCGYTAFTIDITQLVACGGDNYIVLKVDSRENQNIPPFGNVIDYMTYGGIYRDVYLDVKEENYFEEVFLHSDIQSIQVEMQKKEDTQNGGFRVIRTGNSTLYTKLKLQKPEEYFLLRQTLKIWKHPEAFCDNELSEEQSKEFAFEKGKAFQTMDAQVDADGYFYLQWKLKDMHLWDVQNPILYEVTTEFFKDGKLFDVSKVMFGFRKAQFCKEGFYLNDRKLRIRGLNRHQSFPYVGYAMPASIQRYDADILKKELGLNAVRTSHYPQSQEFIDRCNELGLLVFTELPGWQHIGDESWKDQAVENVKEMVLQYRNHPSIILWGVRINESIDDDTFYIRTNKIAKALDPYRATGGVRRHKKSSLLEDVYTYNDFVHSGKNVGCEPKKNVTADMEKPYLVTEYNGHMYPTKSFDWEEHRTEHALRHARVLNAIAGEEEIAGSFGWCMADYNTHKDFGSGDRICYHGVLDMFRNPKLAAAIYASQQEERAVLELSTSMDIGEHPASSRGKNWIFTNADSVKMYKNNRFIKEYKKEDSFCKHMAHGPILLDDFIGDAVEKEERFSAKVAKELTEALNSFALNGMGNLPFKTVMTAAKMMIFHGMDMAEMEAIYTKHVGDWGGNSTQYRFEAVKNGRTVATVVKEPMKQMQLVAQANCEILREGKSYDVAAIRFQMVDENRNLLYFCNEPLSLSVEGVVELIGPNVISLKGGMGGCYIKTTGEAGNAILKIHSAQAGEVELKFEIFVEE